MTPELCLDAVETRLGERDFRYDFALRGAGIVAVNGPSGAGKSTLLHLIAGFETPTRGRIMFNGQDMTAQDAGKRPITTIFQDHNLFAHLDVFTNVALGISPALKLTASDKQAVSAALEKVGLGGFERRMTQDLSGGERQRVAFARALVRRRPLLLLDEPFASLDIELRRDLGDLLKSLQHENAMLVLMISHDLDEIVGLADRVVEIRDGQAAFVGEVGDWRTGMQLPNSRTSLKFD